MIFPSNRVRIMVATKPIDFRKGHDSLAAMVTNELRKDPVADGARCVLDAVEALAVDALFFQRPDHVLDHAVLLGAVGRNELLLQPLAADQGRLAAACADQAVA